MGKGLFWFMLCINWDKYFVFKWMMLVVVLYFLLNVVNIKGESLLKFEV